MELKNKLVIQNHDGSFEVWTREEYDSYIAGPVSVGAGSGVRIVTHFAGTEDLLRETSAAPAIEDVKTKALILADETFGKLSDTTAPEVRHEHQTFVSGFLAGAAHIQKQGEVRLTEDVEQAATKWSDDNGYNGGIGAAEGNLKLKQAFLAGASYNHSGNEENLLNEYAAAGRVINLYLKEFCNEELPFTEMIADAARKAAKRIEELSAKSIPSSIERRLKAANPYSIPEYSSLWNECVSELTELLSAQPAEQGEAEKLRLLLRETIMRNQLSFPTTEQDLEWFEAPTDRKHKDWTDFFIRIHQALGFDAEYHETIGKYLEDNKEEKK